MKSGTFPDARCKAGATAGFIVSIELPRHPDDPSIDSLYPQEVDGTPYRKWLESLPGVIHFMAVEREGFSGFDLFVRSADCPYTPEQFSQMVQNKLNQAGFQW